MTNRLYRSRKERMLGGVCGGLGAYFGIDAVIVRLVFVALAIWAGMGVLGYLILWIIIPAEERTGATSQDVISDNVLEIEHQARNFAQEARSGFVGLSSVPAERTIWAAVALIVVGAALLLGNLFNIPFSQLWPVALIALGVYLIIHASQRR